MTEWGICDWLVKIFINVLKVLLLTVRGGAWFISESGTLTPIGDVNGCCLSIFIWIKSLLLEANPCCSSMGWI